MAIELPSDQLDALSVAEKVRLLEQVWQSLCCQPDALISPEWHADTRIPWNEAKAQLQRLAE
jgi:hypothetical protein